MGGGVQQPKISEFLIFRKFRHLFGNKNVPQENDKKYSIHVHAVPQCGKFV
jgi:hypothetical protein